jgi:hypothetical protein
MKPGEQITCPHCGAESFLVKKSLLDGWTKIGEILACSACAAKIADLTAKPTENDPSGRADKPESAKLAALLGTDTLLQARPKLTAAEDEKRFCRDCDHLIKHAFLCHCTLHDRDVNPMDDCPDFTPIKPKKSKS